MTYSLTECQEHFAVLFIQLGNFAKAYRSAYPDYRGRNASEYGRRLLQHKGVIARIESIMGLPLDEALEQIRANERDRSGKRLDRKKRRRTVLNGPPTGDAILALANVAVCPNIPPDHRKTTIEVLQLQLAELHAAVCVMAPCDDGGSVGGLQESSNGQTMVGSGVGGD